MIIRENVIIDKLMENRIIADRLSPMDKLKLTLANFAAELFPTAEVYIDPQQQDVKPPCIFIDFYEMHKQRRLQSTAQYEIGFTISYLAKSKRSTTELDNAMFLLEQHVTDIGNYGIQSAIGSITDGIATITGLVKINEVNLPDDPFIMQADKIINL